MKKTFLPIAILLISGVIFTFVCNGAEVNKSSLENANSSLKNKTTLTDTKNIAKLYSFKAKLINGEDFDFSNLKGKVVLVVNTASECGFTGQYAGLEELHQKFNNKGLEILAFPCNQFGRQEPGTNKEIESFCSLKYQTHFKVFEKIKVNGSDAHPLYKYLRSALPGFITNSIKWNFTKFLLDTNGKPIKRYASNVSPKSLTKDISALLP